MLMSHIFFLHYLLWLFVLLEFELVQNAFFTDPNDQSAWFYHRWLLGRGMIFYSTLYKVLTNGNFVFYALDIYSACSDDLCGGANECQVVEFFEDTDAWLPRKFWNIRLLLVLIHGIS